MTANESNCLHQCCADCAQQLEQNKAHFHALVCSSSCNHKEHERTGFSTVKYSTFSNEDIFDLLDDSIANYLSLQDTIF